MIGAMSVVFRDNTLKFLLCRGKEERFEFDFKDIDHGFGGGASLNLGILHPFRFLLNIALFSFVMIVPMLYYKIFNFRKEHDTSVQGSQKQSQYSIIFMGDTFQESQRNFGGTGNVKT